MIPIIPEMKECLRDGYSDYWNQNKKKRESDICRSKFQPLVQEVPSPAHQLRGVLSQRLPRSGTEVRRALTREPRISDIGQVVMALHEHGIILGGHP